ncbi:PQQ-binding-like beta-propeller repeat protein [Streptomyces sp. NPDC059175]|uniref:outer membrane protein assembly factor BamB family protein n=1 Tax=unclassified Streptomyces TaxID=2593676 RepID=UPI003683A615
MRALRPGTDPQRLGPYQILAILGSGGMATVYLATVRRPGVPDPSLAVVKSIRDELRSDPYVRRLFGGEIAALQRMDAFGTLQLLDHGVDRGRPWFATEYVAGMDLRSLVTEHGPLRTGTVLRFAAELATILVRLKTHRMVHRDLKPSNILTLSAADGTLRLIDFGVVRNLDQTRTWPAVRVGTDGFMAPEQVRGEADHSSDMFALGLTLVYAVRGTRVERTDLVEAAQGRAARLPDAAFSELEPLLARVVRDCVQPLPQDRLTAEGLLHVLAGAGIRPTASGTEQTWLPDTARPFLLDHAARTKALVPAPSEPSGRPPSLRPPGARPSEGTPEPREPELRWTHDLGGRGYFSSPVATPRGVAVCSLGGSARSLAAEDGEVLWRTEVGARVECTPAVADGLVFVSCSDRTLRALDLETGAEQWRYSAGDSAVFTPAAAAGRVLAGARDGSVHCLDAATGKQLWVSRPCGGTVFDAPLVAAGAVYASAWDGSLQALALRDGTALTALDRYSGWVAESALADGVLYLGGPNGTVCALEVATRRTQWRRAGGPPVPVAAAATDALVCAGGADGAVRAYDRHGRAERWKADVPGPLRATPVIDAGTVYVGSGRSLTALSTADGRTRWVYRTHGVVHAPPLIAHGHAFVGSWDCRVEALALPCTD